MFGNLEVARFPSTVEKASCIDEIQNVGELSNLVSIYARAFLAQSKLKSKVVV